MTSLTWLPLGIGSVPHTNTVEACDIILRSFPDSPFWPELPRQDWRQSMGVEQARGLPGSKLTQDDHRVYFDLDGDLAPELEDFYEAYLSGDKNRFRISGQLLPGLSAMIKAISGAGLKPKLFKGQLTGPTTLGLILKDAAGRPLLYDEQMMDVLVKSSGLRAAAMVEDMAGVCETPVVFFDEPMLQSIGSASIPIDRETAVSRLKEVKDMAGCLTGCHCCGNTDWSIVMSAGVDIIAFDAWLHSETLALYSEDLRSFISSGGFVAWGIVPASPEGASVSNDILLDKLAADIEMVADRCGVAKQTLYDQSLITPSCGLGSLSENEAEEILRKTAALARQLRP